MRTTRGRTLVAAGAAAGLMVYAASGGVAVADDHVDAVRQMERAVTLGGVLDHLRAFQQIADVSGGNRAAGTEGYAASAGYVMGALKSAGYRVDLQPFPFTFYQENVPSEFALVGDDGTELTDEDFATFQYSGSGEVTGTVQAVDVQIPPGEEPNSSTSGCEAEDFAGFTAGSIALVQRGTCTFQQKAQNAAAAGAVAVVIFNEGQEGRTDPIAGTLGAPVDIPVIGIGFPLGEQLATGTHEVRISTDTTTEERTTYNVLAETRGGRADNVVMAGAHLDSVLEGPGINDNGSGSGALLEVALEFARVVPEPPNKVRFAWWAAEEWGLLGAEAYVEDLTTAERGDIALYLNFDMVASPNFGRFVYDGDDSDGEGAPAGPAGSEAVEEAFEAYFASRDLPTEGTDFSGRSDYGPFIAEGVGIPAGGLFTGAEDVKSEEQAERYGGRAGVAFDACYHQACDTIRNISNRALTQNADAIAHVITGFAFSTEAVNERPTAEEGGFGTQSARSAWVPEHRGDQLVR